MRYAVLCLALLLSSCLTQGGSAGSGTPDSEERPLIAGDAGMTGGSEEGPPSPQDNPPLAAPVLPACPWGGDCEKRLFVDLVMADTGLCAAAPSVSPGQAKVSSSNPVCNQGFADVSIGKFGSEDLSAYLSDGMTINPKDADPARPDIQLPCPDDGRLSFDITAGSTPARYHLQIHSWLGDQEVLGSRDFYVILCPEPLKVIDPADQSGETTPLPVYSLPGMTTNVPSYRSPWIPLPAPAQQP